MKIGVVGHGSIGSRHAANARGLGHEVKVYDPANVRDFKRESELYDWCDAAVIATPSLYHEGPLRACIERGKHALVEKPIATLVNRQLPELLREADAKGLVIMMGNNLRFHPGVRRAKEWLCGKTPIWANFICATPMIHNAHEGVILSTGAHEVDVAMHLFGPVQYVAGASARYLSRGSSSAEDAADFTLVHEGKVRSTFHLDFITAHRVRQFWIATDDGNLHIDLDERGSYDDDYVAEMREFVRASRRALDGVFTPASTQHFRISRIEGADAPGATGYDGLETLHVLLDVKTKAAFH